MQLNAKEEIDSGYLEYAKQITKQVMARFRVAPHFFDDYLSAAYSGLVEAASRYDTDSDVPFEKYAYFRVRGAVIDHIRQSAGHSSREYRAAQLLQASDCLTEDFQQIRPRLDARSIDEALAEVLDFAAKGALLFRMNYFECEEEIVENQDEQRSPEDEALFRESSALLKQAVSELPPREQIIINAFYFEGKSFQQIADEDLHVTRS